MEQCYYGSSCNRPDCIYKHDSQDGAEANNGSSKQKSSEPCMPFLAGNCPHTASVCRKRHPGKTEAEKLVAKYRTMKCRFGDKCKTKGCLYVHPRDGDAGASENGKGPAPGSSLEADFPPLPGNNPNAAPAILNTAWRPAPPVPPSVTVSTSSMPQPQAQAQRQPQDSLLPPPASPNGPLRDWQQQEPDSSAPKAQQPPIAQPQYPPTVSAGSHGNGGAPAAHWYPMQHPSAMPMPYYGVPQQPYTMNGHYAHGYPYRQHRAPVPYHHYNDFHQYQHRRHYQGGARPQHSTSAAGEGSLNINAKEFVPTGSY